MQEPNMAPLKVGTPVQIDIAQGLNVAQGIIMAAEYDDGWLYRIDITSGDACDAHRNDAGELWVCDAEVQPADGDADEAAATSERVAREMLGVPTLRTRKSDQLDFHEVAVWQLRDALRAAYEAGRQSMK